MRLPSLELTAADRRFLSRAARDAPTLFESEATTRTRILLFDFGAIDTRIANMASDEQYGNDNFPAAVQTFINQVLEAGINGVGPLKGAEEVADEYESRYGADEKAITRLIRIHTWLAASEGFATGVGGFLTLPVSLPTGISGFYIISTRMVASIASLRGYDVHSEEVRTGILMSLLGAAGVNVAKEVGVEVGEKIAFAQLKRLPGHVLVRINKAVGFRLLTKFGEKGGH